ncbi:peptidoglycan-binding domain-containing protein [Nocardiopsis sp. HUAS JQ3]|uniref:peptidoglycan recognition protein family protein n=1 Tax=Nocardiopsis sp. HUAS JQ3 TaxID=3061629 RepID=UPI0023A95C87|nr:peptidoglycan-binding domain-containing protein [Nocardiopsis sp. HUAS JQ3]WDZ91134.1 peptidoglycan-binding domain-containing protein [Nocardiopsis sp. HUAS JQ3]
MAIRYVPREQWAHRQISDGAFTTVGRTRGVKVHYTGGSLSTRVVTDHDECLRRMRGYVDGHLAQGWTWGGYNACVCGHRDDDGRYLMFEWRGVGKLPAANGAGLNSGHQAVLVLVGSSGHTEPTEDQVAATREAVAYTRARGHGSEVKGHRDGYATSCPGGPLYALLRAGKLTPGASGGGSGDSSGGGSSAPRPTRPGEAPPYAFPLPAGHWFGPPSSDSRNHSGFYWPSDRPHVEQIQRRLRDRGWGITVDGRYGEMTAGTVEAFQREKGLVSDGLTGSATWPVLWTAPIT